MTILLLKMPLFYKFVDANDADVGLPEIDTLIRIDFGLAPNDVDFCEEFTLICNIGDIVWSSNEWHQDKFEKLMGTRDDKTKRIFKKYLNVKYKYECWIEM